MSTSTLNGASEAFTSTAPAPNTSSGSTNQPEEIGWYFVESYYTTLNKSPDRLHLFYQKKSSFIWGTEGDNVPVSQGRHDISERIKQLEFKDCKVRVNNVDSQGSGSQGIIVQVLGDMTNNSEPSRRFSQTFFLAEQTNPQGYYVLNDIFRYLKEDEDEEDALLDAPVEEEAAVPEETATVETSPAEAEEEAEVLPTEEPEVPTPAPVAEEEEKTEEIPANGADEEEPEARPEPEAEKVDEPPIAVPAVPTVILAVPAVPVIPTESAQTEQAPVPQTTAEPPKEASQTPPPIPREPPKPAKPASWAALLATKSSAAAAAASAAPAPSQPAAQPAASTTTAPAQPATPSTPSGQSNSGWQTTESRRQSRPVSISGPPEGQTLAYVKNVTDRVNSKLLKDALSKFGTLKSFEVNTQRQCAFVEFGEPSALVAAQTANPHRIGDQNVFVEERRMRPPNAPYGGPSRGGPAPRGEPRQGSRGGPQRGGDRDRFDGSRNSISGRGGQGGARGSPFSRGGRGGTTGPSTTS